MTPEQESVLVCSEKPHDRRLRHGHCQNKRWTPTWGAWRGMRARCMSSVSSQNYKDYAGRGITICERWQVFENFLADMGEKPEGRSLDRINNDGNYSPENCRWATPAEQVKNRRLTKTLTIDGRTLCLEDWAREGAVTARTINSRIAKGWTPKDAVMTPTKMGRPRLRARP